MSTDHNHMCFEKHGKIRRNKKEEKHTRKKETKQETKKKQHGPYGSQEHFLQSGPGNL